MILLFLYFVPPLIVGTIILFLYHYKKVDITTGYILLVIFMVSLGPVGFILGGLYIHDNFTKESIFN